MVLMLLACIAKHGPERAAEPTPIDVVPVLSSVADSKVTGATDPLSKALGDVLAARNLQPTMMSTDSYLAAFAGTRDTRRRIELLHVSRPMLLVETETAFYSELSGRYRWIVKATVSLEPAGLTESFEVPVFLQFQHEREPEAVSAAAPVIARRAGELVDGWLAAP